MAKYFFPCITFILLSCNNQKDGADAFGNFEATEVQVAAQTAGPLILFTAEEGQTLKQNDVVGMVDTVAFALQRNQLLAQRGVIASQNKNVVAQIDVLNQQKKNLQNDLQRIQNLLKEGSATQKQLDDIKGQMDIVDKQVLTIEAQNSGITAQLKSVDAQVALLNDQIRRAIIINPVNGTVLTKYAEQSEVVIQGKTLYKIGDLTSMELRSYISGEQLSSVKIGQQVTVHYDIADGKYEETIGTISWIASSAEFTPKIVQTKEERTNLVYAIKVTVPNTEGKIKIGMPGEVYLK